MTDAIPDILDKLDNFYMPGSIIAEYSSLNELEGKLDLGFGLEVQENYSKSECKVRVIVSNSGQLKMRNPNHIWIESMSKVYVPVEGDRLVCRVVKKVADYYLLDFGGSCLANLSYLHFQDATKNNRPNVKIGDIICCQVSLAGRGIEPEVTCVNSLGKAAGMGVIDHSDDSVIRVDLCTARKLVDAERFPMLKRLGLGIVPHELVVGSNGWVWLAARSSREFVTLANCVALAPQLQASHIRDLVKAVRGGMFCVDDNNICD